LPDFVVNPERQSFPDPPQWQTCGDDLLAPVAQVHFQNGGERDRISPHERVEGPFMLTHGLVPTVIEHCCDKPGPVNTSADLVVHPQRLAADSAYGSAEMLGWPVDERAIEPHTPVFDKSARDDGTFARDAFAYDQEADIYRCPAGKVLTSTGTMRENITSGPIPIKEGLYQISHGQH
jgi:hypothetical protein